MSDTQMIETAKLAADVLYRNGYAEGAVAVDALLAEVERVTAQLRAEQKGAEQAMADAADWEADFERVSAERDDLQDAVASNKVWTWALAAERDVWKSIAERGAHAVEVHMNAGCEVCEGVWDAYHDAMPRDDGSAVPT